MIRLRASADMTFLVGELAAISLFSGAGGLDAGVESAGFSVRAALEYDRDSACSLRANFPHAAVVEQDIGDVSTRDILAAAGLGRGDATLLVGGPPCTPFSKSGNWLEYKRSGQDPTARLLDHYLRMLVEVRPRAFLMENVFGLAYRNHNQGWFAHFRQTCERHGYNVAYQVLLAADYGIPQKRQRLFVVGALDGKPILPLPTHSGPHETRRAFDSRLLPHVSTSEVIGELEDRDEMAEPGELVAGKYGHLLPAIPPGDNYLYYTSKRGHPDPQFEWRKRFWSFLLKLDPAQPSPTIQAQPGPYVGPFHWNNRRLRLLEIKRLQTFADDHVIYGSRRSAQKQVGNAVPPLLAEQVAAAVRDSLRIPLAA